jgi:hypothetical protein
MNTIENVKGRKFAGSKILETDPLENLRKQHLWGDISDDEYRRDRTALERQLKAISPPPEPVNLPNLDRGGANTH